MLKNKKFIKVLSIIMLVVMMLVSLKTTVFADGVSGDFDTDTSAIAGSNASNIAKTILGTLKWCGVGISIGMLIFLGIKYVTSAPEGKANLKGQLGVYVLGFVFIIAATSIVGILENTMQF